MNAKKSPTRDKSRLVATHVNNSAREDVHANTPPLKAAFILMSRTSSGRHTKVLALFDASLAFLHAALDTDEMLCVRSPRGICKKDDLISIAQAPYGARKAGQMGQELIYQTMVDGGFTVVQIVANTLFHADDNIVISCHGDDLPASADPLTTSLPRRRPPCLRSWTCPWRITLKSS